MPLLCVWKVAGCSDARTLQCCVWAPLQCCRSLVPRLQPGNRRQAGDRAVNSQHRGLLSLLDTGNIGDDKCDPSIYISTILLSTEDNYSAIEKGGHYSVDNGVSILCSVLLCGVCIRCQWQRIWREALWLFAVPKSRTRTTKTDDLDLIDICKSIYHGDKNQ